MTHPAKNTLEAVLIGIRNGWTPKETAFHTGKSIRTIQNTCSLHKLHLAYGGRGPKPTEEAVQRSIQIAHAANK